MSEKKKEKENKSGGGHIEGRYNKYSTNQQFNIGLKYKAIAYSGTAKQTQFLPALSIMCSSVFS